MYIQFSLGLELCSLVYYVFFLFCSLLTATMRTNTLPRSFPTCSEPACGGLVCAGIYRRFVCFSSISTVFPSLDDFMDARRVFIAIP